MFTYVYLVIYVTKPPFVFLCVLLWHFFKNVQKRALLWQKTADFFFCSYLQKYNEFWSEIFFGDGENGILPSLKISFNSEALHFFGMFIKHWFDTDAIQDTLIPLTFLRHDFVKGVSGFWTRVGHFSVIFYH